MKGVQKDNRNQCRTDLIRGCVAARPGHGSWPDQGHLDHTTGFFLLTFLFLISILVRFDDRERKSCVTSWMLFIDNNITDDRESRKSDTLISCF
jgi:hypothetical protein